MPSAHANKIIKDIDNVLEKKIDIDLDSLLQKYHEKPERDFIQKYAETKIAFVGVKAYWFAILTTIFTVILTIGLYFFPENWKDYKNLYGFIYAILVLILIVLYFYVLYKFIISSIGNNKFEQIIIRIEDINMQNNIKIEADVISKLNEIISKVEVINPRIDDLEKNVSIKIEAIEKEIKKKKYL
ncbi:Uncharacterised protein [uncultured archaeon]|nr:Uncharacterised protein [uncultured archaeon]